MSFAYVNPEFEAKLPMVNITTEGGRAITSKEDYVDGKLLLTFQNDGKKDKNTWPFDKAFYITLNLAWGGDWGGMWGVDESALPTTMRVDYVRVFQKKK